MVSQFDVSCCHVADVRRLDVGIAIVSHTPLGFLELPGLRYRASFSARSRQRIAEHLRAEAAVHGQDWLPELDGSMKLDKLRAFAAGLGVQQKDPASGSRLSKSQLLKPWLQLYV